MHTTADHCCGDPAYHCAAGYHHVVPSLAADCHRHPVAAADQVLVDAKPAA